MDQFRVSLSLIALAACLGHVSWLAIGMLRRRKLSTTPALVEVLLGSSLLFSAGMNWFAAPSFPLPPSGDLVTLLAVCLCVAASFAFGSLGRGSWSMAVAPILLVGAAALNFHFTTYEATIDLAIQPPAQKIPVEDAVVVTDQGRIFSVFRFDNNGQKLDENAHALFEQKVIRVAPEDEQSNCHGWVFADGRYGVPAPAVAALLEDNGYSVVNSPQPSDVIVYRDPTGEIVHSGRVRRVHDDGQVWIESKWGPGGRYLHRPEDQCYSSAFTYYRSTRPTHVAQIVQTPVTKDSRVARFNGAPVRRARG